MKRYIFMEGEANQVARSACTRGACCVWSTFNSRAVTAPSTGLLDDLYRFSPMTLEWEQLSQDTRLEPRAQHRISALGGRMYLFGGFGNSGT